MWWLRGRSSPRPSPPPAPCGWAAVPETDPQEPFSERWSCTCSACGGTWVTTGSARTALWSAGTPSSGAWPARRPDRETLTSCVVRHTFDLMHERVSWLMIAVFITEQTELITHEYRGLGSDLFSLFYLMKAWNLSFSNNTHQTFLSYGSRELWRNCNSGIIWRELPPASRTFHSW